MISNGRDVVPVEVIEHVQDPDHGQESHVKLTHDTTFRCSSLWAVERVRLIRDFPPILDMNVPKLLFVLVDGSGFDVLLMHLLFVVDHCKSATTSIDVRGCYFEGVGRMR